MKMDRFVKTTLVLIVLLLALNCAKDINFSSNSGNSATISSNSGNSPVNNSSSRNSINSSNVSGKTSSPSIFETSVEAAPPPPIIQVGKTYGLTIGATGAGGGYIIVKVLEIQSSGWVKVEYGTSSEAWVNFNQVIMIEPKG